jgi:inosine-uridine nucleoside N-ribohydrolase
VWIDTDPAIGAPWREVDDAFALSYAFHSPELEIVGISTSYGNASLATTTGIARDLVQRFAKKAIAVYPGAPRCGDSNKETEASDALASALMEEQHVTYIALAPLTNLATFANVHPELLRHIDRVYFVGGESSASSLRFGSGGWLHVHDANVFKDAPAVANVLRAHLPVTLSPPDVAARLMITRADLQQMTAADPANTFLANHSFAWLAFWRYVVGTEGGAVFDVLPLLVATQPDVVPVASVFARIEGTQLLLTSTSQTGASEVKVCTRLSSRAHTAMLERLAR